MQNNDTGGSRDLEAPIRHAMDRRDWSAAESAIAEGLVRSPDDAALLKLRLSLNLRMRRWRSAFAAYDSARDSPGLGEAANNLGAPFLNPRRRAAFHFKRFFGFAVGVCLTAAAVTDLDGAGAALAALLGAAFVVEIGYRWRLYRTASLRGERHAYPRPSLQSGVQPAFFLAVDRPGQVHHPIRAYDVIGDQRFLRIAVLDGKVVEVYLGAGDANGNTGGTDVATDPAAVNILVVGDSYTSLPANEPPNAAESNVGRPSVERANAEWPAFLKQSLAGAGITNVRVLNYARAGHGILQMADTAAEAVEHYKPDVVIFAFVTSSLSRYRYWFMTRAVGGVMRCFRMQKRQAPLDQCRDEDLIDARITLPWAQERLARGDQDALLADIIARQREVSRRRSTRAIDLLSPLHLYSWDRIFFGTPFIDVESKPTPRTAWRKMIEGGYNRDDTFAANIRRIKSTGAAIALIHIPSQGEMIARKVINTRYDIELINSLQEITGEPVCLLTKLFNLDRDVIAQNYARHPHDVHPSLWAKELLGREVARYLTGPLRAKLGKNARLPA